MNKITQASKLCYMNPEIGSSALMTILQMGLDVSRNNASIYLSKVRSRNSGNLLEAVKSVVKTKKKSSKAA